MSLSLITLCLALVADEPIAPEKSAKIESQQIKAQTEVVAKYGNKKQSELSKEERSQMAKDLAEADKAVLEKNGVDPKEWARESLKKDRAAYARGKELVKEIQEKEKAAEEKKKAEAHAPKDVVVQRGVSEENPVTLDEKPNADGTIPVEKGLPPEAQKEQEALSAPEKGSSAPAEEAPKPAKSGKGSRRR